MCHTHIHMGGSISKSSGIWSRCWILCALTLVNESCCKYERVRSHVWMSHAKHTYHMYRQLDLIESMCHVTHLKEACHRYEEHMTRRPCLIQMCHITHLNENEMCNVTHVTRDSMKFSHIIWMCHVPHIWISHVTSVAVCCSVLQCDLIHIMYIYIYIIWMCHIPHVNQTCHRYDVAHIWMCHVTHLNETCHRYE